MICCGRVIEEQKNYYIVDTPSGQIIAKTTGGLRNKRKSVHTGDMVDLQIISNDPPRGIINSIHGRSTFIKRPALANCSHLFCVCTFNEPPLNLDALDRMLISAQIENIKPCVIINKSDILSADEKCKAEALCKMYTTIEIPAFMVSAVNRCGIDKLVDFCSGRITAFTGLSGVGKTSILSAIFPDCDFRIGKLSAAATRGTHTTTNVSLLPLGNNGYIADTPGIAFIDLPIIPEEEVIAYFQEIADCTGECRFNNCRHVNEPGCSVIDKVKNGIIASWRHEHYRAIYNEMRTARREYR